MPMLFSLRQRLLPDEKLFAFLDDLSLSCQPVRAEPTRDVLRQELWSHAKICIHHRRPKCATVVASALHNPPNCAPPRHVALAAPLLVDPCQLRPPNRASNASRQLAIDVSLVSALCGDDSRVGAAGEAEWGSRWLAGGKSARTVNSLATRDALVLWVIEEVWMASGPLNRCNL